MKKARKRLTAAKRPKNSTPQQRLCTNCGVFKGSAYQVKKHKELCYVS